MEMENTELSLLSVLLMILCSPDVKGHMGQRQSFLVYTIIILTLNKIQFNARKYEGQGCTLACPRDAECPIMQCYHCYGEDHA